MEFVPGKSEAYNAGWESFFIDRDLSDNPHLVGTEQHKEWDSGFGEAWLSAASRNRVTVKSIQEARQRLTGVEKPALFVFPSQSLGSDDLDLLMSLQLEAARNKVAIKCDEADFLQTKAERLQSALRLFETGRLVKKSK
ncbi:MAG: hypothetical protein CML22_06745 [Rheinheimera sp.]|nr:hypothetical protein [Rheinheimera sp.]MBM33980.1 hypothetical protein [Rheinheimera sp.]|tara:strand:- start:1077 stop:1493 length:417 start_codon:yes stop_codon:yes gene_type:complete